MEGPKLTCNVVLHCNRHPHYDYRPTETGHCQEEGQFAWIAVHHDPLYRQLVVIQQIKPTSLTYLNCLAKIALPNVARVVAMYHDGKSLFSVTEYIELGIADLLPLTENEIAGLFAQVSAPFPQHRTNRQLTILQDLKGSTGPGIHVNWVSCQHYPRHVSG